MAFTVAIGLLDISTSVGYLYTILQERRDYIYPSQHAHTRKRTEYCCFHRDILRFH